MTIGFVYILDNEYMPDVIKIGCTERSPHERAAELSKGTAVPAPFRVLCYVEVDNFQQVERDMHEWCKNHRISPQREFFHLCTRWAVSLLWYLPQKLSFCDATTSGSYDSVLVNDVVCTETHESVLDDLRNPWGDKDKEDARIARLKRYAEGDFGDEPEEPTETPPSAAVVAKADALLERLAAPQAGEPAATQDDSLPWEDAQPPPPEQPQEGAA